MGILQYSLPCLQVPAAQYSVAHIHIAVQMHKTCDQPGSCCAQQSSQRLRQKAAQPRAQRPYAADDQPYQGQASQHFSPGALPPYFFRAGNGQEHTPRHEKAVYPVRHGAVLLSTGGAGPPSSHIPRQIPLPALDRYPPGPEHKLPSSPGSPRRRARYRRTRR